MSSPTGVALALELLELGASLREQRYRREHLNTTEDEVQDFMRQWMLDRPGAPHGDAVGVPSRRFQ